MTKILEIERLSGDYCVNYCSSQEPVVYTEAIDYMEKIVNCVINGKDASMLWFLEHPSIYTMGSSAKKEDVMDVKFPIYHTSRGGQVTYHGPGQRIVYLVLDLHKLFFPREPDISAYIRLLEQSIIDVMAILGFEGKRLKGYPGVWIDINGSMKKIAAIGVKIKRWVCYHGIAININPTLEHFNGIIPCGIKEYGVTSLNALGATIKVQDFDRIYKDVLIDRLRDASNS